MTTNFTVLFNKVEQLRTESQSEAFNCAKRTRLRATISDTIMVKLDDGINTRIVYNCPGKIGKRRSPR